VSLVQRLQSFEDATQFDTILGSTKDQIVNLSAHTGTQQLVAAARHMLRAGGLKR
jgi:hypothetical protein